VQTLIFSNAFFGFMITLENSGEKGSANQNRFFLSCIQ